MAQSGIESGQFRPIALPGEHVSVRNLPLVFEVGTGFVPAYKESIIPQPAALPHVNVSSAELAQLVGVDGNGTPSRPTLLGTEGAQVILDEHLPENPIARAWGVAHPLDLQIQSLEAQQEPVREHELESATVKDVTVDTSLREFGVGLARKGLVKGELRADERAREMRDVIGPIRDRKRAELPRHKVTRSVGSTGVTGMKTARAIEHKVQTERRRPGLEERRHIAKLHEYGEPMSSRAHLAKAVYTAEGQAIGRLNTAQVIKDRDVFLLESIRQAAEMPHSERDMVATERTMELGKAKDQDPVRLKWETHGPSREIFSTWDMDSVDWDMKTRLMRATQTVLPWTPRPEISESVHIAQSEEGMLGEDPEPIYPSVDEVWSSLAGEYWAEWDAYREDAEREDITFYDFWNAPDAEIIAKKQGFVLEKVTTDGSEDVYRKATRVSLDVATEIDERNAIREEAGDDYAATRKDFSE